MSNKPPENPRLSGRPPNPLLMHRTRTTLYVLVTTSVALLTSGCAGGVSVKGKEVSAERPKERKGTPSPGSSTSSDPTVTPSPSGSGGSGSGGSGSGSGSGGSGSSSSGGVDLPSTVAGYKVQEPGTGTIPHTAGTQIGMKDMKIAQLVPQQGQQYSPSIAVFTFDGASPMKDQLMSGLSLGGGTQKKIAGEDVVEIDAGNASTIIWQKGSDTYVIANGAPLPELERIMEAVIKG